MVVGVTSAVQTGVEVVVRGWLHGNCVLLPGGEAPGVIDTGYHTGAEALVARWQGAGRALSELSVVLLTHIHSDHAGGVAALVAGSGAAVVAHGEADRLTRAWSPRALWLEEPIGQEMPRFGVDRVVVAGDEVAVGGMVWRVVETPGHAMGGVSYYCAARRLLVSGDALWQKGFGLLNPWIDGPGVYDRAAVALDNLAGLDVETVIPGHGPPFEGFAAAVSEAQSRLEYARRSPHRLRHQVVRNTAHFTMLLHPERSVASHRQRVLDLAGALPPLPGDAVGQDDAVLAAAVCRELGLG
ncbi:MAG: glyoxylase-like metal-dependent hydrolase (beta-lactamase superfamily II) [Myxococcota bacterium]